jgi:acetyl esterase/lipase
MNRYIFLCLAVLCFHNAQSKAVDPAPFLDRVEVYGSKDGLGLLMDVIKPDANANGAGLIYMVSGGMHSNVAMAIQSRALFEPMAKKTGYTIFLVMHGSEPRYLVNEIYPDLIRASRYIHYHAKRFQIDPEKLGTFGGSSGGWCALMLGTLGDDGDPNAPDPIDRQPSRVQAVAAFFPPTDFMNYGEPALIDLGTGKLKPFRRAFFNYDQPRPGEEKIGPEISPVTHVTKDDPPVLLIHGDKDPLVPLQQSQLFQSKMQAVNVPCKLLVKPGAGHGWVNMQPDIERIFEWFDECLLAKKKPENTPLN